MKMGVTKFNIHSDGNYWKNYFEKDIEFYDKIKEHMNEFLNKESIVGIDVGAGPGVGAKILDDLKIKATLVGYEPSDTSKDGIKLADELESVDYTSLNKGILDICEIREESLDFILFLRSSHEIAESIGGKDKFFSEVKRIAGFLKKGGRFIFADPSYKDQDCSMEIVKKVQEQQMKTIRHTHIPSDYVDHREIVSILSKEGFELNKEDVLENRKVSAYLKEEYDLDISPCIFYILTLEKV